MTLLRPDVADQVYTPAQFVAEDQSTAFSQEILKLSQKTTQPTTDQTALPSSPTDKVAGLTPANPAVEKLPSLTLEEQPKSTDAKLGFTTNAAIDFGLGTAAVIATEVIAGILTKNPKFEAMALETFQTGGKMALYTSPKFIAPHLIAHATGLGAATISRHYAVEGLTGKSESWMESGNHVALGAAAFVGARYVGKPAAPSA